MKLHRHLFVDELNLPPSTEWTDHSSAWRFVRVSRGVAYWLGRAENKELASGQLIVVAPNAEGVVRASQISDAQLHCFEFSPELLGGFFSLAERHYFDAVGVQGQPAVQFLAANHPAAQHFGAIVSPPLLGNSLLQRCEALRLAVTFFVEELIRHRPPPSSSTYALHRFRTMIQQIPDQKLVQLAPEQLAETCGCSLRHFGRLFRKHFGVSLRARQTELRLLTARQLLLDSDAKVIQVAMESGYRSLGLFNTMFKRAFGMTPTEWRQKHFKKPGASKLHRAASLLFLACTLAATARAADKAPDKNSEKNSDKAAPGTPPATVTNKPVTFAIKGYEIHGNTLLSYEIIEPILTNYVGPAVTAQAIGKAVSEFQMEYRNRGFATVKVILPPQQLTNGLLRLEVVQGKLVEIDVTGNRYFSSNNVMRALPSLRTNIYLNSLVFNPELDRANRNLDRQIYPVIGAGPDPGTSTLHLKVTDHLPLHGRFELNNFSTPNTPELRMNMAAQFNNLWQLDHQLGVQYSFTPEQLKEGSYPFYDKPLIANYSAFYRMPLSGPNGDPRPRSYYDLSNFGYDEASKRFRPPPSADVSELLIFASRSFSDTGNQLQSETLTPSSIPPEGALQVSDRIYNQTLDTTEGIGARMLQPLPEFNQFRSSLAFGPDFKRFHSSSVQSRIFQATIFVPETGSVGPPFTTFTSPPTKTSRHVTQVVNYLPLALNWEASRPDRAGFTAFNVNNTFNWSGFFNNADAYESATGSKKSDGNYYVGNFGVTRDLKLSSGLWSNTVPISSCWSAHLHADGQWATQPLISNEQFGNGGNAGVRGYRDGQVYSDTGWRTQIEIRSPQWDIGMVDGTLPASARLFAFMDYGESYLLDPFPGQSYSMRLWGTGFGAIANFGPHVDARVTFGFPLLDLPGVRTGTMRVTFAVGGQF